MRRQGEIRGQACLHSEGQEVSGEDRFDLFGKTDASEDVSRSLSLASLSAQNIFSFCLQVLENVEYLAIRNLHSPKGRRFQENIALICSERTVASEVRKIRMAEDLFCLFGVLVSK